MDVTELLASVRARVDVDAPVEEWEMDAAIMDSTAERLVEDGRTEFLTAWIVDFVGRHAPKAAV